MWRRRRRKRIDQPPVLANKQAVARLLEAGFFQTPDTVAVARALLGKCLRIADADGAIRSFRICEVEAYHGEEDLACHASRGRTARTDVMYAPGGVWYVYLCYGIHEMLNVVTGPRDRPSAVLIRGVDGIVGPGRLTRALGITRRFNGRPATPETGLWLEDDGRQIPPTSIHATPRVGVDYAGEWAAKPWRFYYTPPADGPRG
jgi:DNA-3-methyladenine glycosylase